MLLPPPLLTSLDEAKTATKSTSALTADVFQLTTPVATPQNRAGVKKEQSTPKILEWAINVLSEQPEFLAAEAGRVVERMSPRFGLLADLLTSTEQFASQDDEALRLKAREMVGSFCLYFDELGLPTEAIANLFKGDEVPSWSRAYRDVSQLKAGIPSRDEHAQKIIAAIKETAILNYAAIAIWASKEKKAATNAVTPLQLLALEKGITNQMITGTEIAHPDYELYKKIFTPEMQAKF